MFSQWLTPSSGFSTGSAKLTSVPGAQTKDLLIRDEDAASTREGYQASAPDAPVAVAGD